MGQDAPAFAGRRETDLTAGPNRWRELRIGRRPLLGLAVVATAALLEACTGGMPSFPSAEAPAAAPQEPPAQLGRGQVKVGLILPLSAGGNAGLVAQSMRNAAELAISEFNAPNIQLLVKDDAGTAAGAQQAAQTALDEGAEIILGPLFAQAVAAAGQVARTRNIPVIAFSTDASVASRGVYLLSFLPESDVNRIVSFAVSRGKRSFAAMIPENAYGNVVDAAFRQAVAREGARIVVNERYTAEPARMQETAQRLAQGAAQSDAVFLPGDPEVLPAAGKALAAAGVTTKKAQFLGTGLWDDPRVYAEPTLQGGWFSAPENSGFRGFSARYKAKYGLDPLRATTLAYDAVSLIAALVKTQGPQRFSEQILTNSSGFSGIDGIFRFRPEGINERGLSVFTVTPSGPKVLSPPPKAFNSGT